MLSPAYTPTPEMLAATYVPPPVKEYVDWPGGKWGISARNAFLSLLQLSGKPALALELMEELDLWRDHRRAPAEVLRAWAVGWREGSLTVKPKIFTMIQKQYDGLRRADVDASLRLANAAHRTISKSVIEGKFDKDTSGALQHLGQFAAIGLRERTIAFDPRQKDPGIQVTPQFFLSAPPERRQIEGPTIDAEVKVIG